MQGTRLPDNTMPRQPGEYAYQRYANWETPPPQHPDFAGEGEWYLMAPDGCLNSARKHAVTVHGDGTITCSPSLVFSSGWHGFLQHGEWSQC